MATEVIPHFPDRLSNYTKEALTGLADIIVPSTQLTATIIPKWECT
ncbi:MAG: hypothetical protein F6K56_45505 [Moorea sp. SIO3G5]|nr:hypothetical protein [Moorena sp. SIO3G5]